MDGFARKVFTIAGIYGLIVLVPQYLAETPLSLGGPTTLAQPESFYGFVGIAIAWQVAFLLIGRDPVRFRSLMPVAILEKLVFVVPVTVLYLRHRSSGAALVAATIDLTLGVLFAVSYRRTPASRAL